MTLGGAKPQGLISVRYSLWGFHPKDSPEGWIGDQAR